MRTGTHAATGARSVLQLVSHRVQAVSLGSETRYDGGTLAVSEQDVRGAFADDALVQVRASWVSPGDSARVVKLLDTVEPRTKARGGGGVFPGFLGPAKAQGRGETHVVRGVAVMAAGYLPRAQEAVLDMSGPGALLSPFGGTHNLVVEFAQAPGAPWERVDVAVRRGLLELARLLADATLGAPPDDQETVDGLGSEVSGALPRIGAITNLQTQGTFKDVFVYGRSFAGALPTFIDPNELDDGAVVSGQFGHPALKNPTYLYQNHPVVRELRARHGRELQFAGLVLAPEPVEAAQKELVAAHAARLCATARLDGVVVTKEGGGNADADISLKIDALADLGIPAVGLFAEMSGAEGTAPPVVVPPERGTDMISTGNYDEIVRLPAVARALGGSRVDVAGAAADAALEVPTAVLYAALSPIGAGRLRCEEVG
ncbi:MAG TPA: glycine/sarcosine/betaine reductase component B subunit [Gemmatimonadales bacterium]|nr:glycine/sarcosine/betaine reductase component B subunit [Gemmatimonadales bacterium]